MNKGFRFTLKLENVWAGYDSEIDILRGVSFGITEHTVTAIIGPNGAGKTTAFRTIFSQIKAKKGKIEFNGTDITNCRMSKVLQMGMGYVPQGRCNFPKMTVKENLEMGAYLRNDKDVKRDIENMYAFLPVLNDKKRELAGNLSGGEQQMLEMAMGLMLNPKLLLLDEPSLGLAPKPMAEVLEKIKGLKDAGVTIMMVEQNAKQALGISDHAVVLDRGVVRFEGTGAEIGSNKEVKSLYLGGLTEK